MPVPRRRGRPPNKQPKLAAAAVVHEDEGEGTETVEDQNQIEMQQVVIAQRMPKTDFVKLVEKNLIQLQDFPLRSGTRTRKSYAWKFFKQMLYVPTNQTVKGLGYCTVCKSVNHMGSGKG